MAAKGRNYITRVPEASERQDPGQDQRGDRACAPRRSARRPPLGNRAPTNAQDAADPAQARTFPRLSPDPGCERDYVSDHYANLTNRSRFAALSVSAEDKEVSPRAVRYGGRFDGKLKMASGRDRLIAGSILAAPTLFWHIALSRPRVLREDDDHGRQQDDGANVNEGCLPRSTENAPYLAAFVASSCSASEMFCACFGSSTTFGPSIVVLSIKGVSSKRTISSNRVPPKFEFDSVSRRLARARACRRASSAARASFNERLPERLPWAMACTTESRLLLRCCSSRSKIC